MHKIVQARSVRARSLLQLCLFVAFPLSPRRPGARAITCDVSQIMRSVTHALFGHTQGESLWESGTAVWAYTRPTGARSMSRAGRKRGSERRDASESEREHTCVTRDLFCVWPVVGVLYGVRVCDFSCIKSVWVAQKRPNFPARASRRSQKFLVSLGARAPKTAS